MDNIKKYLGLFAGVSLLGFGLNKEVVIFFLTEFNIKELGILEIFFLMVICACFYIIWRGIKLIIALFNIKEQYLINKFKKKHKED